MNLIWCSSLQICNLFIHFVQASYFRDLVPLLEQHKVLFFTHADSRLANNDIPDYIQHLRCRVNYRALRYAEPIQEAGDKLVARMQSDESPYIALHLRLLLVPCQSVVDLTSKTACSQTHVSF